MKLKEIACGLLFNLILLSGLQAQERISSTINSNWLFLKGDITAKTAENNWVPVSIPHTWNTDDVMDDAPGYYRGDGWYKKTIYIPANGEEVLSGLSNTEYLQPQRAVATKLYVSATNNKGITVSFKAIKGEPVLNGIQIQKIR